MLLLRTQWCVGCPADVSAVVLLCTPRSALGHAHRELRSVLPTHVAASLVIAWVHAAPRHSEVRFCQSLFFVSCCWLHAVFCISSLLLWIISVTACIFDVVLVRSPCRRCACLVDWPRVFVFPLALCRAHRLVSRRPRLYAHHSPFPPVSLCPSSECSGAMYLMKTEDGTYTLKKVDAKGLSTSSAHPARFSPDDKFSRHRVTLKKRFGTLDTSSCSTCLFASCGRSTLWYVVLRRPRPYFWCCVPCRPGGS